MFTGKIFTKQQKKLIFAIRASLLAPFVRQRSPARTSETNRFFSHWNPDGGRAQFPSKG
jgi:hypothetical protein